jgi:organic radical activating enzyme
MEKISKNRIEFYITNVCNFNCDNCNRLNNYHFSGHESWAAHADLYSQWADKVEFKEIYVLGGEPTLHPELDQWARGLRTLWPRATIQIITNGTRLKYWHDRGFFDLIADLKISLGVNLHNRSRRQEFIDEVRSYLINPIEKTLSSPEVEWKDAYNQVKDPSWPDCESYEDFESLPDYIKKECQEIHKIDLDNFLKATGVFKFIDQRGIEIDICHTEDFVTAPLKYVGDNKFSVYDSDPNEAHEVCWSKHCTHMMRGKMYKCHHVALLPEFAKQFHVEMTREQSALLSQYQPLTPDVDPESMINFFHDLPKVIPQCTLCPSKLQKVFLESSTDKPKIKKKTFHIKSIY